jgi:hypothetical protein
MKRVSVPRTWTIRPDFSVTVPLFSCSSRFHSKPRTMSRFSTFAFIHRHRTTKHVDKIHSFLLYTYIFYARFPWTNVNFQVLNFLNSKLLLSTNFLTCGAEIIYVILDIPRLVYLAFETKLKTFPIFRYGKFQPHMRKKIYK